MRRQARPVLAMAVSAATAMVISGTAAASQPPPGIPTVRASVAENGRQADSYAYEPAISGDGRYVAFASDAPGLVPVWACG